MKILYIIVIFCAILLPNGAFGATVANVSAPVPVSIEAASLNNPSDIEVRCNEYSTGWCYLYVYGNKTHPRFTPVSNNSSQITRISLSGRVPVLADDICNAFPNAVQLNLDYANIEEILPGAFDKCRKVETIYLSGNNLRNLPKETFRYNLELENLQLYNNKLKQINSWVFASLFKLKQLSLHSNYLTEFPAEVVKTNKELETLNLYKNDILDLDEVELAEKLPNLRSFYVNNNQLSCDRLEQIRAYLQGSSVYVSDAVYTTFRKRYYLQDTLDNFLCLPTQTWLNVYNQERALKKEDSIYKLSLSGLKN